MLGNIFLSWSYLRYYIVILMVSLRLKVGPKGQVVIPKVFREAYGIREGGEVVAIPTDEGLILRGIKDLGELFNEIIEWKSKVKGIPAKLGDLASIDLEEEFL